MKDFEDLVRTIVTLCSGEEQERLREMEDWIVKAIEPSWASAGLPLHQSYDQCVEELIETTTPTLLLPQLSWHCTPFLIAELAHVP